MDGQEYLDFINNFKALQLRIHKRSIYSYEIILNKIHIGVFLVGRDCHIKDEHLIKDFNKCNLYKSNKSNLVLIKK